MNAVEQSARRCQSAMNNVDPLFKSTGSSVKVMFSTLFFIDPVITVLSDLYDKYVVLSANEALNNCIIVC